MKKFLLSFLIIFSLPFLFSCGKESFRDDLSCAYISKEICDETSNSELFSSYSKDDITTIFGNSELYDDSSVVYSTETNDIDEIGVFHCPGEDAAKALLVVLKNYISDLQENQKAFIASYAPREIPKLEDAEVRRYKNYVVYTVLDENSRLEAFEEIQELLQN